MKDLKNNRVLLGFTLPEVLITLGIIGVVAALSIPILLSNAAKEEAVAKLKKEYTVLAQAVKLSEIDNGPVKYWDWGTDITVKQSFDTYWAPYLKILKYCNTPEDCGYASNYPWRTLLGDAVGCGVSSDTRRTTVLLSDGELLMIRFNPSEGMPAQLFVDLDASKGSNMYGKDFFYFVADPNKGLVPYGYNLDQSIINGNCKNGGNGIFCTSKIVADGWQMKSDYPW